MFNSIRIKLTIWYLSILALIILGFSASVYLLIEQNLNNTVNKNLISMSKNVTDELRQEEKDLAEAGQEREDEGEENDDEDDEDDENDKESSTIEEAVIEEIRDLNFINYRFAVFLSNGKELVSTIADKKVRADLKNIRKSSDFSDISGEKDTFRVHQTTLYLEKKEFRLLITYPLKEKNEFLSFLLKVFYITVPVALLLAGLGGYLMAQNSLLPVVLMSRRAEKISSSNLNERLPVKNKNDELGKLAGVFNALLKRLENSFKQQQRFIADASHELRTPLAIIRTESEVAVSKKGRKATDYRESLEIVHDESKRLTKIVEDLFLLTSADREQFEPSMEDYQLDEILADSIRSVRTLAEKRNIKINFKELPEMPIRADETLLHRLFLNLLDNAIKYNRENGLVLIDAKIDEEKYAITVSDTGIGIPPEKQAKIFDRFYRTDEARSRLENHISGGAGLGLSIAVWIAEIHGGALALEKSGSEGSSFRLELPFKKIRK